MPRSEHFKAWVQVDNEPLPEYKVETDADGTIRCWIPSEEGKSFEIHWQAQVKLPGSRAIVTVDGQKVRNKACRSRDGHSRVRAMRTDAADSAMHCFVFGKVVLTDDEAVALKDEAQVKAMGTIEMVIETGTRVDRPTSTTAGARKVFNSGLVVHEKMKKAACHRVVPGGIVPKSHRSYDFISDDLVKTRFVFHYSPKEHLQAMDIIPIHRPPAPLPSGNNDRSQKLALKNEPTAGADADEGSDASDADEERLKILEEQMSEIKNRMKKRKSDGKDDRLAKKAKVEDLDARSFFQPGEIIDLT